MNDVWVCSFFDKCESKHNCVHKIPHMERKSCKNQCSYPYQDEEYCKYLTKLEYEMRMIIKED